MHSLMDLILEGVMNSAESGAKNISVEVRESGNLIRTLIEDGGELEMSGCLFDSSYSTKGPMRGYGLSEIKKRDEKAEIIRDGLYTKLSFQALDDSSLDDLRSALLPLFIPRGEERIDFRYYQDDTLRFELSSDRLEDLDAIPYNAHTIANFNRLFD